MMNNKVLKNYQTLTKNWKENYITPKEVLNNRELFELFTDYEISVRVIRKLCIKYGISLGEYKRIYDKESTIVKYSKYMVSFIKSKRIKKIINQAKE